MGKINVGDSKSSANFKDETPLTNYVTRIPLLGGLCDRKGGRLVQMRTAQEIRPVDKTTGEEQ